MFCRIIEKDARGKYGKILEHKRAELKLRSATRSPISGLIENAVVEVSRKELFGMKIFFPIPLDKTANYIPCCFCMANHKWSIVLSKLTGDEIFLSFLDCISMLPCWVHCSSKFRLQVGGGIHSDNLILFYI